MTKGFTQSSIFSAALLSALGFVMLASGSAEAAAGNFDRCKANNKQQVITCCDEQVKKLGKRPLWMVSSGSSCKTAARCVWVTVYGDGPLTHVAAPKRVKKCYIPRQNLRKKDHESSTGVDRREPDRDQQYDPRTHN